MERKEVTDDLLVNSPTATVELPSRGHRADEIISPTVSTV